MKPSKAGTIISLPFRDRDGDGFSIYLKNLPLGYRLSDAGSTFMRFSYENDIEVLTKGNRGRIIEMILSEAGMEEDDGELFKEISADRLIPELFSFTKALGRISDMCLWSTHRTASTFYEDLKQAVYSAADSRLIHEHYHVPGIPLSENYEVDFYIEAAKPLYIMGAANQSQLKLATIVLQHLKLNSGNFDSMVVLSDTESMPKRDLNRLMVAANDIVPSIQNVDAIIEKIQHRLAR